MKGRIRGEEDTIGGHKENPAVASSHAIDGIQET